MAIEDDSAIQKVLKRLFETEGYSVDLAKDGLSGLERFCKRRPAIVLDLLLPDISGEEVCQQITRIAPGLPVIVLSAKAEVADKVVVLEMGAWDYVTKPFSPRELLARIRVAIRQVDLRSAQVAAGNVFRFDDVTVNIPNARLFSFPQSNGIQDPGVHDKKSATSHLKRRTPEGGFRLPELFFYSNRR